MALVSRGRRARFNRANTPLLEPAVALIAGILAFNLSATARLVVCGLALGTLLLFPIFRRKRSDWRRIGVWGLFFVAGVGLSALRRIDPTPVAAHHGERLTLLGRVESIPQLRGRWWRSTATVYCYADSVSGDWIPLNELKITLHTDTSARNPQPQLGDLIRFRGRIYGADSTGYDRYMLRTRGLTGRCFAWNVTRLDADTTAFRTRIERFRHRLGQRLLHLRAADTADAAARIMQTLTTGDQSEIDPRLRQRYARSGTAHLLAVSGLHVGVIFVIINLLFGWLRLFRHGYIALGIVVILSLGVYALLTGLSPSVIRAVVMFSLLQIGLMLSRYTNSLNTLCAAALGILAWNPYNLYHIGFQLSFAAVIGILTLCPPLARLWRPRHTVLRWLWSLTLVGATAQLCTAPLVLYHFGQLQYAGLLLNPVIWFTVPAIIGGSLLYLVSGWEWVYTLTHRIAGWQNAVVDWTAARPWSAVSDLRIAGWVCVLMYLGIIGLIVWINRLGATKTRSYFSSPAR